MDTTVAGSEAKIDPKVLEMLLGKLLQIGRSAESVALRSVRKVRFMALIGMLSVVWLTFFLRQTFSLSLTGTLPVLLFLFLPPLLLGKLYFVLQDTIGLPQRLMGAFDRIRTGSVEFHLQLKGRMQTDGVKGKRKLSDLWRLGKVMMQVRALGNEANEIISVLGGAMLLSNPVFAAAMLASVFVTLLLFAAAVATSLYSLL